MSRGSKKEPFFRELDKRTRDASLRRLFGEQVPLVKSMEHIAVLKGVIEEFLTCDRCFTCERCRTKLSQAEALE